MNRKRSFSAAPWIAAALVASVSTAFAQPGPGPGAGGAPGMAGTPMMMHARQGAAMHRGPGMGLHGRGMRGNRIEHLLAMSEEINLTDAQRDKLRQIRRASPAALMPKRQAVMEAQMDLRDAMDNEKADTAALRKAHDKVLKARTDLAAAMFDLRVQVREVLTPEQRQKLHEGMRKQGRAMMKRQPAPGHGDGFFEGDGDDDADDDGGEF